MTVMESSSLFSIAVINTTTKAVWRKRGFIWSWSIVEKEQGQTWRWELELRSWRALLTDLLVLPLLANPGAPD